GRNNGPALTLTPITETDFHVKGIFFNLHFKKDGQGQVEGVQFEGYNRQLYLKRLSPPANHAGNSFSGFPRKVLLGNDLSEYLSSRFPSSIYEFSSSAHLPITPLSPPSDTLTGRVYHWADLDAKKD